VRDRPCSAFDSRSSSGRATSMVPSFCATVIGSYVIACVLHNVIPPDTALRKSAFTNGSLLFNNLYFLVATACVCVAAAYFGSRRRFEDFRLRHELDVNNDRLTLTLNKLQETEVQLVQSEKMNALGRLSAGLLHEINNPLNFATTGLFTLRNKAKYIAPEQQEVYAEILRDVEEGINHVKTIVSDLRMFTHPETESRDQVEIADVIGSALRFLSNEWKDQVLIEQNLAPHQTVWANKNKLIHVIVNLLQNSLDALKTKKFPEGEKPSIRIEGRVANNRSIISVRDNGPGIGDEHLDKIFDPFYTTKDVGEGMGLGLSICYRIVQECDGRISVNTEPGKFCEFTLEFPIKG